MLTLHEIAWKHLWQRWGMSMETNSRRIEQVHNLHVFHLLQSASPNTVGLDVGVPPRGLHGEAYRGLIMWDELFIMPLFNLRIPDISQGLLMYRYRRLPRACSAAEEQGYRGAMFPWQSGSNGEEQAQTLHLNPESGRWIPDNTQLQRHINIAIAYNIWQYFQVSGNVDFISFYGAELFLKIVRFWTSKAEFNRELDRYEIRGVMGPDEFHDKYPEADKPGIDNNAYTNVMVAWILARALEMLDMLPQNRRRFIMEDLSLSEEELSHWDEMSRKMKLVFHDNDIISQFEGYGDLKEFDWEHYKKKYGDIQRLDRILEAEGDSPNNYKLSKQADVLMLFYLFSSDELHMIFERLNYPFDAESIPRNIEYYSSRTSHGSTLSRIVHAWLLVRSRRKESWKLFRQALESDIEDIQGGTTHEGIHLGAMAGTVDMILRCYSGIETRDNALWFNPRLPKEIRSLNYCIEYRRNRLRVDISPEFLELQLQDDARQSLRAGFRGETFSLRPGERKKLKL
ncbi:MAG: glycosyl hydrolase family 65 protein [Candidatus Marinimicrobia bacterium]|nr:glycosyl hydrolase family 65 protein [Candidatus Neomarinimicrobiota bacterium]